MPAVEMKTYKYFLVEENRNHWAVGEEIPHELFKNVQCTEKYFILGFCPGWFLGQVWEGVLLGRWWVMAVLGESFPLDL